MKTMYIVFSIQLDNLFYRLNTKLDMNVSLVSVLIFSMIMHSCRWFDVMQKTSNQLRSNIANATRNRGDKVRFFFCSFF